MTPRKARTAGGRDRLGRGARWARHGDEALLDLRFCDLGVRIERSPLRPAVERLEFEMERRGFRFKPHYWLSEEWFSPDGVPGISIPFYLAHPRLARLERGLMRGVEGGDARSLIRILRHEAGHAIDTAYRLRRRKRWREIFGPASTPYPTSYTPRPISRRYVMHLGYWYAQSHPTEDFAETFAVWLRPNSAWRTEYAGWPAFRKLCYVDDLMREIRDQPPAVRSRAFIEPLRGNTRTLRDHYRRKLSYYDRSGSKRYDTRLRRVFAPRKMHPGRPMASAFLRQVRPQLQRLLIRRSRLHPYLVDHVLRLVSDRTRELDLCVHRPRGRTKRDALGVLARILSEFVRRGRERYAL